MLLYGSYFVLIVPINWWYRRRGREAYGLTRAGRPWKTLILAAITTAVLVVFAWTRSLIPSMIAHAIINIPMTPRWQGVLLVLFAIGGFFAWRGGIRVLKQVFANTSVTACVVLAVTLCVYVLEAHRINAMTQIAVGMIVVAVIGPNSIGHREQAQRP
jgi:hypothetical protein